MKPSRATRVPAPRGYRLGVELAAALPERYPELAPAEQAKLAEAAVVLVVEFSSRRFDTRQLALDLRGRHMKAVVARRSAQARQVAVIDAQVLRETAVECDESGRLLRLERSLRRAS
ncbi:hypothetical protein ACMA1D_17960 [Streptomyces sp. 796.1]|uniref:hypothetical protein n=1 Tax=Streptomyces sp. 796.1 TaxID=3163029 RepID=UPI0039C94E8D